MNVAVIEIKKILKHSIRIIIMIALIIILINLIFKANSFSNEFLLTCINKSSSIFSYKKDKVNFKKYDMTNILASELKVFSNIKINDIPKVIEEQITEEIVDNIVIDNIIVEEKIEMPKNAVTEKVTEKNIAESSTDLYSNVKIKNKTDYELTEEIMFQEVEINNKKDILIFHTHACESYTPSEKYNYEMTGNYRTTDNNYNMVRVGSELKTYLENKGFNVTHDITLHDYPAYSGSYDRSLETVQNQLYEKTTEIVIDLHRDAVGNGDTYGPTVKIDGQKVAQLMFVIGTNGGGLEHPNWIQNLKIAIKIQTKANEMYPGLFRPIILTNSRYNQHTAKGASIIEVGATANTLEECLLSMQCLANVLEEVCK